MARVERKRRSAAPGAGRRRGHYPAPACLRLGGVQLRPAVLRTPRRLDIPHRLGYSSMDGVAHSRLHLPFGGHRRPTAFPETLQGESPYTGHRVSAVSGLHLQRDCPENRHLRVCCEEENLPAQKNFLIFMSQNALSRRL